MWQMPHFFALAWLYRVDYARGCYKMLPLNDPSGERTSSMCFEYSLYLAALPLACWLAGLTSCMFPVESVAFNGALLLAAWRFRSKSSRGQSHARRLFLASLAYLPIFFGCLLVHQRRPLGMMRDEKAIVSSWEPLQYIRARGRDFCLHRQIVDMCGAVDPASRLEAPLAQAGSCPVPAAEKVCSPAG